MIDEGQDFEADWLRLVSLLINADTQSLLLVEDRAQTIYKRKRSYLQDTGLSFQRQIKGVINQLSKYRANCKVCLGFLP